MKFEAQNHSHSLSYEEDLQQRNPQKDFKINDMLSVVGVLIGRTKVRVVTVAHQFSAEITLI